MWVYRIEKLQYARSFPPTGSLYAHGRWHRKGMWVVYVSETVALAKLETLANSSRPPKNRTIRVIQISDHAPILKIEAKDLPKGWNDIPYPNSLAPMILETMNSGDYIGVAVPSVQSPHEYNYLLFPQHQDFAKYVQEVEQRDIDFDNRLK